MLEVQIAPATFADMQEAQRVLDGFSSARYSYGPDRQSYEFNMDATQLVVRNNGRKARSGLGLYGNTLADLQTSEVSLAAHKLAIQEVNEALESMDVPPARITQVVAMFQPYTAYVEMEADGVKFLMTYAKSWSAGTGHRRFTAKDHYKIEDSSTHGENLVRWFETLLNRKAMDPRFILKISATSELISDEMLATQVGYVDYESPEGKLKRKIERQIERINKQQLDFINNFATRGKVGWLTDWTIKDGNRQFDKKVRGTIAYKFNTAKERDEAFSRGQAELPGFVFEREDME